MPKTRDLYMLRMRHYGVQPKTFERKEYPVLGFDTETDNGKVTIIVDSNCRNAVIHDADEMLQFLTYRDYRESSNFFFNLGYDALAVLKHLSPTHRSRLSYYNTVQYRGPSGLYRIDYIPGKCLKVKTLGRDDGVNVVAKYFDISQFYQFGSLEKTYNRVFTSQGKEYRKRLTADDAGFPIARCESDPDVALYCCEDAQACFELAKNFTDMANDFVNMKDYYSPASISKAMIRQNLLEPYRFRKSLAQDWFLKEYSGGRFEVIMRGSFGLDGQEIGGRSITSNPDVRLHMVDINSAYPAQTALLEDTCGRSITNRSFEDDVFYSVYKVNVTVPPCIVSPMKAYINGHLLAYPQGRYENAYVTKSEYTLLDELGLKPQIISAKHLKDTHGTEVFGWIRDIYALRRTMKAQEPPDPRQLILKLAANACYGVAIQTVTKYHKLSEQETASEVLKDNVFEFASCKECGWEDLGDLKTVQLCPRCHNMLQVVLLKRSFQGGQFFNAAYAATITSGVRCQIYRDAVGRGGELEKNVVMFATDSITFDKKPTHLPISDELGEYSYDRNLRGIILGSGLYTLFKEDASEVEVKNRFRGFGKESLYDIVCSNQKKRKYTLVKKRPMKLKESRRRPEELNVFVKREKNLRPDFDQKRVWERPAKTFGDLLHGSIKSSPLSI